MTNAGTDFELGGHAGGGNQRLASGGDGTEEIVVGEVGRGHLVSRHAPAIELLQARGVPRGAERDQPLAQGVIEAAEQFIVTELETLQ